MIADLAPPPIEPYTPDDPAHKIVWAPYPRTNQISHAEKPALLWEVMTEVVEFSKIVIEIESLLFDEAFDIEPDHIWSAVNRIYSRIRIRLECLPSSLKIGDFPIPQTLFVR